MLRYYVEIKDGLNKAETISFYMMAYSTQQVIDMLGDEYFIVTLDQTD